MGNPPIPQQTQSMLEAHLGSYTIFLGACDVVGTWGFDADDHLVGAWVEKWRDSL